VAQRVGHHANNQEIADSTSVYGTAV